MSEWRLDLPHDAEDAFRTAMRMAARGEPFELHVDYRQQRIYIERRVLVRAPVLSITFMSDGVRVRVNGKLAKEDAERIFLAALISKPALFAAMEKFIQMPILVDITVW